MAGKEFVDGWILAQTLGEGAYGEVKLLVNRTSGEAVAMKTIDLQRPSGAEDVAQMVRKEVCVHNKLKHPNIIQYYGHRQEVGKQFIFLEYAAGGELFDRIEPDSGMAEWLAQKYFKQLIAGVEYMHTMGIAHRDLKPENLLLDAHDNLKISDFGMATVFRMRGNERLLDKRCGTLPYLAPEVLLRSYQAEPADLWACGIILVAMLTGELPWDQPTPECAEYVAWKDRRWSLMPWPKVEMLPLSLLQRMLMPLPKSRCKLAEIKVHRWVQGRISRSLGMIRPNLQTPPRPNKRQCSDAGLSSPDHTWARLCQSQPEPHPGGLKSPAEPTDALDGMGTDVAHMVSFSQPAQLEDLLLSSQLHTTQNSSAGSQQSLYQKLVRRMTRFFVQPGCEESQHLVTSVADELGWVCRTIGRQVTITCMDRRKMPLTFKLNILYMDGKTLLDFRLSKGCGLEFKRNFLRVKEALGDTVLKGPVTWPIAIATNSVP